MFFNPFLAYAVEDMLAFTSSILRSLVASLRLVSGTLFSFFPFSVAPRRQHSISRMQLERMFAQRRRRRRRSNSRKREGEREKLRDRWMDGRSGINIGRLIFLMRQSGVSGLWFFFRRNGFNFHEARRRVDQKRPIGRCSFSCLLTELSPEN